MKARAAVRLRKRHEVDHLAHPLRRGKACHQHVGVGQVHLPTSRVVQARREFPFTSPARIKQGGEHGGAIEIRPAEEVDDAVIGHESRGPLIADDAMGFDRPDARAARQWRGHPCRAGIVHLASGLLRAHNGVRISIG